MRAELCSVIFIAFLFVIGVKCIHAEQFSEAKLVDVETIDENGNVKMRVMAQSAPTGSRNNEDSKDAGADDEDTGEGSGDSSDMNSHELRSDVAHDEPMAASGNQTLTSPLSKTISPSPSPTTHASSVMTNERYSTMTIITTTKRSTPSSNSTVATIPRATSVQPSSTSSKSVLIEPTSVLTSTQVVTSSSSVTESPTTTTVAPEVKTEAKTTVKTTTDEPSTVFTTHVNKPTTRSPSVFTKGTKEPEVTVKLAHNTTTVPKEVKSTTVPPTKKSTEFISVDVGAHHETTEKPGKTLFGFVTVEILIALLAGALFSILLVAFLVYRLKKRNEGSYELSETIALRPKELDEMGAKKEVFV